MSKNTIVPRIAAAIILGFGAWVMQQQPQGARDPGAEAALAFVEAAILNGSTFDQPMMRGPASDRGGDQHAREWQQHKHTNKLSSGVAVHIVAPQEFEPNKPMHLIGTLKSESDLPSGSMAWQIPEGLEVIEGDLNSSIAQIKAGQAYSFHLVVKQADNLNRQVHLAFTAKEGGMEFSEMAQYNTVEQKKINSSIQRLKQRHLKYLEDSNQQAGRKPTQE